MKKILGGLLLLIFLCSPAAYAAEEKKAENPAAATNLLLPQADDNILGDPAAPVTLVEYASLSCPHCAAFAGEVVPKLDEKYIKTGKLKYIYRHFPLNAPALKAAVLADCVPREEHYTYIQVLFDTQKKWAFTLDYVNDLKNIAALGGMAEADFDACMANKKLDENIAANRLKAEKELKITSTPTIFIDGKLIDGDRDFAALSKIIDAALAKSGK